MASSIDNSTIVALSMQLLQNDLLTNATFLDGQVGKDMRSMLLQENGAVKLTDPTAEALSGRIRSDAVFLRQASDNVGEAKSITDMMQSAVSSINSILSDMQELADDVANGTLDEAAAQPTYDSYVEQIQGIIRSTSYNGINLLSSDNWAGDERVTVSGTAGDPGAVGKVWIQAGSDGFNLNLYDLEFLKDANFTALTTVDGLTLAGATDLADDATATTTATRLSELVSYMGTIESALETRSSSLSSHSSALDSQASIMDTAANTRESTNDARSLEELLLDYILNQVGSVLDTET